MRAMLFDHSGDPDVMSLTVRVPPIEVLPLEDAARAHRMIETGHVRGKLVLKVAELARDRVESNPDLRG